jgi:cephalosporin hydroxylase
VNLDDLAADRRPFETRLDASLGEHWAERVERHVQDSYAGLRMLKFPEDLRVYEHILWELRPDAVVEIGAQSGGSALWFRDRLAALARYGGPADARVVSIDVTPEQAAEGLAAADPGFADSITLLAGDVRDPELPRRVREIVGADARCLLIEDSAHTYETTFAALQGFASFVPPGGWFVVEDGCVDVDLLRTFPDWPRGVQPAIADWLASPAGAEFRRRRDVEVYGITSHPGGFLQRSD